MSRLKYLIHEIHRRSLWQVLLIYVGVSWGVLEAADLFTERLGLANWLFWVALGLLVAGLVVLLVLAFLPESAVSPAEPHEVQLVGARRRHLLTWRRAATILVVALAAWGVVATVWLLTRAEPSSPVQATTGTAIPEAAGLAEEAWLSVRSDPGGASVSATPVAPIATFLDHESLTLGQTPLAEYPLPAGEYLVHVEIDGANPLELLVRLERGQRTGLSVQLIAADATTQGMLQVTAGTYPGSPAGLGLQPFLIDRFEVTNAEYLEFMAAGGYQDPTLWPESMLIRGEPTPRATALKAFVDRTDLPGPREWSGGLYAEGKSDHPVVGVSWYEAAAYARWAGKQLPTWHQWWRAAVGDSARPFPWGNDVETTDLRANFGLIDTEPVGSHPLGVSPFGVHDLAGNVQEWLREVAGDPAQARAVGGSWDAPAYSFDPALASSFDPSYASRSIGFRCVKPVTNSG